MPSLKTTIGNKVYDTINAVKVAVTGKDLMGASTSLKGTNSNVTFNKAIETVANHPFVSAGVVAGGVTAIRNAPAIIGSITGSTATTTAGAVATKTAGTVTGNSLRS